MEPGGGTAHTAWQHLGPSTAGGCLLHAQGLETLTVCPASGEKG